MTVKRWVALLAMVVGGLVLATSTPASAAPGAGATVRASYRGSTISLKSGWRGAQACVVFSRADVRCYATTAESDAVLGYSRAKDPLAAESRAAEATGATLAPAAVPACASGWLCLYADINGGGRRLIFHDEYWQYLSDYGFDRQTSSWRNNQGSSDTGSLSLYNLSSVYRCGANSYAAQLGTYDNQAYAVWG